MNSSRLVASVGGYFVSASSDAIAFHLYGGISTSVRLASGRVGLREISTYPWSGSIGIEVSPETPAKFAMKLRIPGWATGASAWVNGKPVEVEANTVGGVSDRSERPMAARRRDRARTADAGGTHLRPSVGEGECRPGCARSAGR